MGGFQGVVTVRTCHPPEVVMVFVRMELPCDNFLGGGIANFYTR